METEVGLSRHEIHSWSHTIDGVSILCMNDEARHLVILRHFGLKHNVRGTGNTLGLSGDGCDKDGCG